MDEQTPPDTPPDSTPETPAVRPPAPPPAAAPPRPAGGKPGKVTAIAITNLVQGILSTCYALWLVLFFLGLGAATFGLGCLALPFGVYPLVVGILAIVYASKLLPEPPTPVLPARWLAVMQICGVLLGDVLSLAAGIVNLVLFSDPEVVDWFDRHRPDPLR